MKRSIAVMAFLALLASCWSPRAAIREPGRLAYAKVNPYFPEGLIPQDFMGFSHGLPEAHKMIGDSATGINLIYRKLLLNLSAFGSSPPVIRIENDGRPPSSQLPTQTEISSLGRLYADIGTKFFVGVNLSRNNVAFAAEQASAFMKGLPPGSVLGLEIGNEPDDYALNGIRSPDYRYANFLAQWREWRASINALNPELKFLGPSFGGVQPWVWTSDYLGSFISANRASLSVVSQHWYAGSACGGKKNPPDYLLKNSSANSGARAISPFVSIAHESSLKIRIAEMNSIGCDGQAGVSDTFASALWIIDALFEFAHVGIDGVNIQTESDDVYGPFLFNVNMKSVPHAFSIKAVRPEYYGLLFFQQAAPPGSKLLPVTADVSANLKVWATLDHDRTIRVAILNKDAWADGVVTIDLRGYQTGKLIRLLATSYEAKSGVTLGGQTFDGSSDGTIRGSPISSQVPEHDGVYSLEMAPASAALLTVNPIASGGASAPVLRQHDNSLP